MPIERPNAPNLDSPRRAFHASSTAARDATHSAGATAAYAEAANSQGPRVVPPVEAQLVEQALALDLESLLRQSALANKPRS